jgi:hypothetical protein
MKPIDYKKSIFYFCLEEGLGLGATFKHTKKYSQHISKTLQYISLLNTYLIKNAKKYLYNTFKKNLICVFKSEIFYF